MKQGKTRRLLYELLILALTLILLWALLFQLGCWLMPQRTVYGAVWSSYLQEAKNSVDLLFLGSSRVYCDVIPAELYAKTGVTSYVMAGPSQTTPLSYRYLRQCLRTQQPKYVLLEVSGAFFPDVGKDVKANVCYMPLSLDRLLALQSCREGTLDLALFPLQEFHYRIYDKLNEQPPQYDGTLLCGYTPLSEAKAQPAQRTLRTGGVQPGSEAWEENLEYLSRIAALCAERGIPCVCFLAPMRDLYPDGEVETLLEALRAMPGVTAAEDWRRLDEALSIDPATGWYDNIHFNTDGALVFTDFLADYVKDLGLTPTPNADAALWQSRLDYVLAVGTNQP